MSDLLGPLFRPAAASLFSDRARLQGMLDFEAALARAHARTGTCPPQAAERIARLCKAELLDVAALAEATAQGGNPAIPIVAALTRLVAAEDEEAARQVHKGATSQDAIDTGLVLQLRSFLQPLEKDLERLSTGLAGLAEANRGTPIAGRTWLQQAAPTVFGLKTAAHLDAAERHLIRLAELRPRLLVLQFGGAVGTLGSLGDRGIEVAEALARELHLSLPEMPWHAQRDRPGELAAFLGLLTGTLGKMARDLALLAQTEIAEAFEPAAEGRGGSSTMPQKRNPVASVAALAAATMAPGLASTILAAQVGEHERATGSWQAEWPTFPALLLVTSGALASIVDIAEGLEVDAERMRANLDITNGLIMAEAVTFALARTLGKQDAHRLIAQASKTAIAGKRHLKDVLAEDKRVASLLTLDDIEKLFDPLAYQGVTQDFIDRMLANLKKL